MDYIRKLCPSCGNEFMVMKNVEEKAVYCTLKCLSKSQNQIDENRLSFLRCQYELLA